MLDPQLRDSSKFSSAKEEQSTTRAAAFSPVRVADGAPEHGGNSLKTRVTGSVSVFGRFLRLAMFLISFSFLLLSFCFLVPWRDRCKDMIVVDDGEGERGVKPCACGARVSRVRSSMFGEVRLMLVVCGAS